MTSVGGKNVRLEATLQRLREKAATRATDDARPATPTAPTAEKAAPIATDGGAGAKRAQALVGGSTNSLPSSTSAPGGVSLSVRFAAMRGEAIAPSTGVKQTDGVRAQIGNLVVETAQDLQRLHGISLVKGNLALAESALATGDLAALDKLVHVEGNLAIEGNRALAALDALQKLERVDGALYLGFNAQLSLVHLPALTSVGGALVIEGNPGLESLLLPTLERVGGYLHLHENDALRAVLLPKLSSIGGELSLFENRTLKALSLPSLVDFTGEIDAGSVAVSVG